MSTTDIPLSTAWLAPPPKLLAANHTTKLEAAPIAISATIALIVTVLVVILFNRRHAEIFQDDKMPEAEQSAEEAPSTIAQISQTMSAPLPVHRAFMNETAPNPSSYRMPANVRGQLQSAMNRHAMQSTMSVDRRSEPANPERFTFRSVDNTLVGGRSLQSIHNRYGMDKHTRGGQEDANVEYKRRFSWEDDDLKSFASETHYDIVSRTQLGDPY